MAIRSTRHVGVTVAARNPDVVETGQVVVAQFDPERAHVLLEIATTLRAGDEGEVPTLRVHPCQCDLCRRATPGSGHRVDLLDDGDVGRKIVTDKVAIRSGL
jgi:hypothetical protein